MTVEDRLASEALTPMMRQYLGVKAEHPHALVMFRMGDFFETFYEDAEICARLLDLTLTKRSKEKDAPPMAGVPHHAVEGYISRLVDLGKTVVLVDQVEDPKKAKGLVRREVTRVVSPGTFLDPNAPARAARYLVAVVLPGRRAQGDLRWGLAALDLATGELRATAGGEGELLADEVSRLGARELIAAESERGSPLLSAVSTQLPQVVLTYRPDADFEAAHSRRALESVIGVDESAALGHLLPAPALEAAGAALRYAEQTQLRRESFEAKAGGSLAHVQTVIPYLPGDALILDAEARVHLELFASAGGGRPGRRGSLIGVLDQAVTAMGGRLVARWLARPLLDTAAISARQDAIEALVAVPSELDALREGLGKVHDLERLLGRVVMGRSTPRDLASLRASLDRLPDVLRAAGAAASSASLVASGGRLSAIAASDVCPDVRDLIAAALVESPPMELGQERVFREGHDAELDRLMDLSRGGKQTLAEIEQRERERTGISSLKVRYNRVFGYFIEVTKSNLGAVPRDYIRKQTTANGERYYTEELKVHEEQILGAEDRRAAREAELFVALASQVVLQARRIRRLAEAAAELDALAALAHVAERRSWSRPVVDEGDLIEISDGRHPVLEELASELGERFVPNDVTIGDPARLLIITGPNMAGKSTIMRQTALSVILAQMGSFIPARSARIGVVDRVFTRVGASDDLSRGRSTFMVEMTETARILRSATRRSLILLDEIGRGTSTFDGLSIAWAVAEHIHDTIGAKTLFATHYHELTDLVRDKDRAANLHVAVKAWNEDIVFLRKLVPGPTNRSYGVQVARLAGLPKPVVERAREVLSRLEAHELSTRKKQLQLSLFATAPARSFSASEAEVLDAIRAAVLDDTTPRRALELLSDWQSVLRGSGGPGSS